MAIVATPTPTPPPDQATSVQIRIENATGQPLAGIRLQLVDAFGQSLGEAITPASGEVRLTAATAPNTAITVFVPVAGVSAPVDPKNPRVVVQLPVGGAE
ncbi:MAG: hypothetical protein H7Z42_01270 [Roseiflexaceae bacterium]|nr:hypothetical protein [Roseiflexaceae bacterium]